MGLSRQQAVDCFRTDDLIGIGMEADALRRRLHPEGVVTYRCVYSVDLDGVNAQSAWSRIEQSTSATIRLKCDSGDQDAAVQKIAESCTAIRNRFPSAWFEVGIQACTASQLQSGEAIARWADCGANSVFVDARQESGTYANTCGASLEMHRAAHAVAMRTALTIPFGCGESIAERLDFIDAARRLQDDTGGFTSFVPLGLDAPGGRELDGVTAVERLKMLAITRMYLDNIGHLQSAQVGSGLKLLQTGLRFGADDAEISLPQRGTTEQDLRRVIRDAGFTPVERDGAFSTVFLN
jgi:cyclic dehypoxanthinyl futalosine synthase